MGDGEDVEWPEPEVECTYDFCHEKFCTEKDMKRHKQQANEHYYCKKCDLDFDSDLYFIMHRVITKKKHITCPECGKDFRSKVGLDDHVELLHPRKQDIKCLVCNKCVNKAADLLKHVEDGQCKISPAQLRQQRAERALMKDIQADKSLHDSSSHSSNANNTQVWPLDDKPAEQSGDQTESEVLSVEELIQHFSAVDFQAGAILQEQPDFQDNSKPISQAQTSHSGSQADSSVTTFKMGDYWSDEKQAYQCPSANCGHLMKTTGDFYAHLTGPAHADSQNTCPMCRKHFDSKYALLSHMEAPSRKCQIRNSTHYSQILREVTTGLLGTGGHFGDGSVRYIMPQDEGWQQAGA